jgi:glycosyltransferase involved in cell wall biosynthesis
MNKHTKIRVAMVAPPFGETGGPEILTQSLTNALLDKGIDVTLFAPADWKTKAKHVPTLKQSLWNMRGFKEQSKVVRSNLIVSSQMKVIKYENNFDLIHLHSARYAAAVKQNLTLPTVLTMHNALSSPTYNLLRSLKINFVAISKSIKGAWAEPTVIHNGIHTKTTPYSLEENNDYLVTIGRITPEKGLPESIRIARAAGKKLIIIGRLGVSKERQAYFKKHIQPFINSTTLLYKNEMPHEKMLVYLRKASALLFTPAWEEPFGLVAIEALASGTPVIGNQRGALPEIIRSKRVGYLSDDRRDLITAIKNINQFDRLSCRKYAENKFDSSIMAEKYIKLYKKILKIS